MQLGGGETVKIELIKLKNIRFNLAHFAFFQSGPAPLCFKASFKKQMRGFPYFKKPNAGLPRILKSQMRGSLVFEKSNAGLPRI